MRDYKNIKVPRSYRSGGGNRRSSTKRVSVNRSTGRSGTDWNGLVSSLVRLTIVLAVLAAGVLAWQGYGALMHADLFVVTGADIKGIRHLTENDLREIVGGFKGQNIFRADIDGAARRARANPWVREVRIHRRLPNRITMVIAERTPSVILDTGSARYLMDDEGVVIERVLPDSSASWQLPAVAIRGLAVRPGEPAAAEALPEAMELLADIAARGGWRPADVTVRANSPESIVIVYAEHEFKMGSGRYAEKLRRLAEVMADVQSRGLEIASVDLRPERQAAVMVKNERGKGQGSRGKGKKT